MPNTNQAIEKIRDLLVEDSLPNLCEILKIANQNKNPVIWSYVCEHLNGEVSLNGDFTKYIQPGQEWRRKSNHERCTITEVLPNQVCFHLENHSFGCRVPMINFVRDFEQIIE